MSATISHDSFTIERVYPNCLAHVWAYWSVREKKASWLGDTSLVMDFRPGGEELSSFRDGRGDHVNQGRYFEINDQKRIVLAYSMAVNGRVHTVSLATVSFLEEGGGTRVRYSEQMCIIPPSDGVEGRRRGWKALLGELDEYLQADTSSRPPA